MLEVTQKRQSFATIDLLVKITRRTALGTTLIGAILWLATSEPIFQSIVAWSLFTQAAAWFVDAACKLKCELARLRDPDRYWDHVQTIWIFYSLIWPIVFVWIGIDILNPPL